ncbi:Ankyrin repeat-containing protein [Verrucomicrobium sp. GAS474]|uniref:ankyrin repeat domain-containing protein n=1 Tax=Verrucomicrobium sp. GAS474 TaxID=1882831 RepID=UPI00087B50D6|nr:ankyrin repeat domain-containing protein [Verrucomicrobium sp. GAS474]SDT87075.1 Ankyrin repeat-containing protein [Verrucomicrobium sp. GAS474]
MSLSSLYVAACGEAWVRELGRVLVAFLWQGAVIGGLAALLVRLLRREAASLRYLVLCGALLACILCPLAGWRGASSGAVRLQPLPVAVVVEEGRPFPPSVSSPVPHAAAASSPSVSEERAAVGVGPFGEGSAMAAGKGSGAFFAIAALGWLGGVAALSFFLAGGWFRLWLIRHRALPVADRGWQERLDRLAGTMGIARTVALLESAWVEVPMVAGWLRPTLIVPVSFFSGLTPAQVEAIFAHELGHVRRHDYLVNLFQVVVETLFFYHPAVWWIGRRLREEREHCCDDIALEVVGDRAAYARALAALEMGRGGAEVWAMAADGGSLLGRLGRLTGGSAPSPVETARRRWLTSAFVLLVACGVGGLAVAAKARRDREADAALFTAIQTEGKWNHVDFKKLLDRHHDRIDRARDGEGRTLLQLAAEKGWWNDVYVLLVSGADMEVKDAKGRTALWNALSRVFSEEPPATGRAAQREALTHDSYGHQLIRDLLLLRGADVNGRDASGETLLGAMVRNGDVESARLLLRRGAELDPKGMRPDAGPFALAERLGKPEMVALVEAVRLERASKAAPAQAPADAAVQEELGDAAWRNDLPALDAALAKGGDPNGLDKNGQTPLLRAISHQREHALVVLLLAGADPSKPNAQGTMPVPRTFTWFGMTADYMRMALIVGGADLGRPTKDGQTLMQEAARKSSEMGIQQMAFAGVDPRKGPPDATPMRIASEAGFDAVVELLQHNGVTEAPFDNPDPKWQMKQAIKRGDVGKIYDLIHAGFPVDGEVTDGGDNGVILAIGSFRFDSARFLVRQGADVNFQNPKTGRTALHASTMWLAGENEDFREQMLQAGADPNRPDHKGFTPFMAACTYGDVNPKITQMLAHGADINRADSEGHTALYFARKAGQPDAAQYLLARGAVESGTPYVPPATP